ncbi:MAG TPA: peptidoglycan-associated lipoprotein Pal [Pseudomonadales bacterium]|nr:peptidoglycan-associated lipoprotein Pal [Pseudomonadales bacterium]
MTSSKMKVLGVSLAALIAVGCSSTSTTDSQSQAEAEAAAAAAAAQAEADRRAAAEAAARAEARALEVEKNSLETVFYFAFDESALSAETRAALDAMAAYLKKTDGAIRLEGHADERGSREYNMALGERRAKAVANYLSIQGVDRSRFDIISYGEERPAMMGHSEGSWSKNRRAEVKL